MKKTVLTFGLICGAITSAMMLATLPFVDEIGSGKGEILGYTVIVLSALIVFFGIRSYRENVGGGRLTFGRGFAVGILITLISSACYVATWEVVYFKLMPDFADKYAAHMPDAKSAPINNFIAPEEWTASVLCATLNSLDCACSTDFCPTRRHRTQLRLSFFDRLGMNG